MKQINLIFAILLLMLALAVPVNALAGPRAVPVAPSYNFEAVPEGQHIYHDFVIKNEGDAPLNITKVQPP